MAEHITELLKKHQGPLVVFAGNGHILNRYGIPDRVTSRTPVAMATVVTHAVSKPITLQRNAADFIWLTGRDFSWRPAKKSLEKNQNFR